MSHIGRTSQEDYLRQHDRVKVCMHEVSKKSCCAIIQMGARDYCAKVVDVSIFAAMSNFGGNRYCRRLPTENSGRCEEHAPKERIAPLRKSVEICKVGLDVDELWLVLQI